MLRMEVSVAYFKSVRRNFREENEESHEHFERDNRAPCRDLKTIHL